MCGQKTMKKIFVFGHKNPDTDSVVSATAFAALQNKLGKMEYIAARAGNLNPQTDYIYKKFGVTPPLFIPEMEPKVEFYMHRGAVTVCETDSIWKASAIMREEKKRVLPVVDSESHYKSLLSYNSISKRIFDSLDPNHHTKVFTNPLLLCQTLNGSFYGAEGNDINCEFTILSGAMSYDSFARTLQSHIKCNLAVVTGDREDVQLLSVQNSVKVLIISGNRVPSDKIVELAKKNGTSIIVSPYDTASSALLIVYSSPVSVMAEQVAPLKESDLIAAVKKTIADSPVRLLAVVDDNNTVTGIMSEVDLHREANIGIALVDHNELSQAVDGIENYTITDIVDHHRIGTFGTKLPITFMNLPLGSTATILARMYKENRVPLDKTMASLLLCGILSDTLILKSATTTPTDISIAEELSKIAEQDVEKLGEEIIKAGSRIGGRSAKEIITQDMKEYREGGNIFTVSQIEVDGTDEIMSRKAEFIDGLEIVRNARTALFSALLVTDISTLSSLMIVAGEKPFLSFLHLPKEEDNVYFLKDVVSRKKQLIPMISEILEGYA